MNRRRRSDAQPFGFSPKISTTVEKTVEKRELRLGCRLKRALFLGFQQAKARGGPDSGPARRSWPSGPGRTL